MRERGELANRDWLSVRDEAWRIEDFLQKWSSSSGEGSIAGDPVAIILAKEIDSYRHVVLVRQEQCGMHTDWQYSGKGVCAGGLAGFGAEVLMFRLKVQP